MGNMLQIIPLEEQHLEDAARLLAARHRADRIPFPELPAQFQDPACALSLFQTPLNEGDQGVVALAGSRVVGYLLGRVRLAVPGSAAGFSWQPRSVSMAAHRHAVEPDFCCEAYPAMYAALAPAWLAAG